MRLKFCIFIFLLLQEAVLACSVPCYGIANTFLNNEKSILQRDYKNLIDALQSVKKNYEKLLETYKNGNEKLNITLKLEKEKLLREKEFAFLLRQYNEMQSKHIDIRAMEQVND